MPDMVKSCGESDWPGEAVGTHAGASGAGDVGRFTIGEKIRCGATPNWCAPTRNAWGTGLPTPSSALENTWSNTVVIPW